MSKKVSIPATRSPKQTQLKMDKKQRLKSQLQTVEQRIMQNLRVQDGDITQSTAEAYSSNSNTGTKNKTTKHTSTKSNAHNNSKYNNSISSNPVVIASKQAPFFDDDKLQTINQQNYRKIVSEKKKKQQELLRLNKIEEQYANKIHSGVILTESRTTRPKSQLHKQDIIKIKKIKKQYNKFEMSLQQKTIQYEQNKIKMKQQQKQQIQKQRQQINAVKKTEIARKLQQLYEQSQQRQNKNKIENQNLKSISAQHRLFEALDKSWKQKNSSEQKRKYELMQLRIKQKRINLKDLKEHEKKYEEIINQKRKEFEQKRLQMSRASSNDDETPPIQKSRYYNTVIKEDRKARREQQKKMNLGKIIQQKRMKYADYVKQQFMPRIKTKSDQQEQQTKRHGYINMMRIQNTKPQIKRLSPQQIKQMGNRNFMEAKQIMSKKKPKDRQTIQQQRKLQKQYHTVQLYPDYLTEMRQKHKKNGRQTTDKNNRNHMAVNENTKNEAQKIMNDPKIDRKQKIQKIKSLTDKVNARNTDMVSRIMGKIQILELIN